MQLDMTEFIAPVVFPLSWINRDRSLKSCVTHARCIMLHIETHQSAVRYYAFVTTKFIVGVVCPLSRVVSEICLKYMCYESVVKCFKNHHFRMMLEILHLVQVKFGKKAIEPIYK